MDQAEIQSSNFKKLGPAGTIVAGLVLLGVGYVLAFVLERSAAKYGTLSETWPTVSGNITASEVSRFGPRDDKKYSPKITYEYWVDGQRFTSDRLNFDAGGNSSHIRLNAKEITDRYPKGTKTTVYYNPEDPAISCLVPGYRQGTGFLIGMVCGALGGLIILSGIVAGIRRIVSRV